MTADERERTLRSLLERIAPGSGAMTLSLEADLRRELELDSMDFLEFCIGLDRTFGVPVPESDYERVATLARCLDYLDAPPSPPPAGGRAT